VVDGRKPARGGGGAVFRLGLDRDAPKAGPVQEEMYGPSKIHSSYASAEMPPHGRHVPGLSV
jgi:hypothetical protein